MITLGAKLYFGLAAAAVLAAWVLGLASDGTPLGVITFAWAGPVGDQLGFTMLTGIALVSFFLGVVTTALRDADPTAVAEVAGSDELPAVTPPDHLSPWPIVAAVGVALVVIGLVVEALLVGIGAVLIAAATIEWTIGAWADRATGDPDANRAIRNRLMAPIETPAAAVFGIAIFVFFASRVLLAASKWGAIILFAMVAVVILGMAAYMATRPRLSRSVVTGVLLLGALVLIGGGIAGLAAGEREFHQLGEGGENGEHETTEPIPDGADESDDGVDETDDDTTAGDTEE